MPGTMPLTVIEPRWGWFSLTLRKLSTSLTTGYWSGSWADMTSLTLSSLRSPISSRANSELSLAMTASKNGVWSRRGFLKAQNWGRSCLPSPLCNELDVPATNLWKCVDDTTISETISRNQDGHSGRWWHPGQLRNRGQVSITRGTVHKL